MNQTAKLLMTLGAVIFCAGLAVALISKTGLPLGKLPGDISWQGKNVKVFIPITTMILISVVLTLVMNILSRFFRR